MDLDFGASHRPRSCWGENRAQIHDPVGDQRKEEAASRRGGGGNHGQVASVTIIDLTGCVLCVVCCDVCVGQHCVFDVNDACQR